MTNDVPNGEAALSPVLDAVAEERPHAAPAPPTGVPQIEELAVTGLAGNATTLVEIRATSNAGIAEIGIVSRDRHAQAGFTPAAGEQLMVPLAVGDYLVMARPAGSARSKPPICRRVLIDAGRVYGYGMPRPLSALPAAHPGLESAAPVLTRLASTGSVGGAARLVVEWSAGSAAHCLCIRSPQWGEEWLPYAIPSAAAFCLSDGAYEIRAALLAEGGIRLGAWSEVSELVIAEGRLAASPSSGGNVLDWIGVKRDWRPDGTPEIHPAGAVASKVGGKVAIRLTWQGAASAGGVRHIIAYRRESGGEWETAIAASSEQTLELAPGRYRLRICAVDDVVFLRSEFFAECVVTVSASDSPVLTPAGAAAAPDASIAWMPLPERESSAYAAQEDALREFIARPISALAAEQALSAVDLNRLAYGRSPHPDGPDADIAVARAVAQGGLPPDQMAAAGDYFLRAGRLDTARHLFEELGRRYRGVDYAQLRCAQLAAICGRGEEARELLTLALLPAKDNPTRSQTLGSAVPKAARDRARVQQQAAREATATADLPTTPAGSRQTAPENKLPQYAALLEEMAALRFKAQQYDRLMREVPTLRGKAKRYDEAKGERAAGRGSGVVRRLRRWSRRLAGLRLR